MKLECTADFGNFKPGDTVEVDDDAKFDEGHFKRAEAAPKASGKKDEA